MLTSPPSCVGPVAFSSRHKTLAPADSAESRIGGKSSFGTEVGGGKTLLIRNDLPDLKLTFKKCLLLT